MPFAPKKGQSAFSLGGVSVYRVPQQHSCVGSCWQTMSQKEASYLVQQSLVFFMMAKQPKRKTVPNPEPLNPEPETLTQHPMHQLFDYRLGQDIARCLAQDHGPKQAGHARHCPAVE